MLETRARASSTGFVGNFKATISQHRPATGRRRAPVDVGSVIVCTGYKEFDAARVTHYGYGKLPNVITSFEFERDAARRAASRPRTGGLPQYVAIIHCVGSRSEEFHGYCSRVCCMTALKYAHEIKSALPGLLRRPTSTSTCTPSARAARTSTGAAPRSRRSS